MYKVSVWRQISTQGSVNMSSSTMRDGVLQEGDLVFVYGKFEEFSTTRFFYVHSCDETECALRSLNNNPDLIFVDVTKVIRVDTTAPPGFMALPWSAEFDDNMMPTIVIRGESGKDERVLLHSMCPSIPSEEIKYVYTVQIDPSDIRSFGLAKITINGKFFVCVGGQIHRTPCQAIFLADCTEGEIIGLDECCAELNRSCSIGTIDDLYYGIGGQLCASVQVNLRQKALRVSRGTPTHLIP
jgi:hypothetical protein